MTEKTDKIKEAVYSARTEINEGYITQKFTYPIEAIDEYIGFIINESSKMKSLIKDKKNGSLEIMIKLTEID
jgi:hypothetical protein